MTTAKAEFWGNAYEDKRYPERTIPPVVEYNGDIAHMTMGQYREFRARMGLNSNFDGMYGITPFDRYLNAREAYIEGKLELDDMLAFVRLEDDEKYDNIFNTDPAYQHREPISGPPPKRRVGRRNR